MPGGRPPKGPKLVRGLQGSARAKARLEVVLGTVAGRMSVETACRRLGVGKSAFHRLRASVLEGALKSLEPKAPGRPPRVRTEEEERIAELEHELNDLKMDLHAARVREEIALTMPFLLQRRNGGKKGGRRRPQGEAPRRAAQGRHGSEDDA